MKFNLIHKGYTLIEAMIALTVLSASIVISLNIIVSSADSESLNQDLLIGAQLVEEGVQIIINLYQSNLLKFGAENIEYCALMLPSFSGSADTCFSSTEKLEIGNYFIAINTENNKLDWTYNKIDEDFIIGETINESYQLHLTKNADDLSLYTAETTDSSPSSFYRVVNIENITSEFVTVGSKVSWIRNGGFITTRESSFIINYN